MQIKVRLVSSSGVCGTAATEPAVEVSCEPADAPFPHGSLLPDAGQVPYQRAGSMELAAVGVAKEPLEVYSVGTKISSWRIVQLDNAQYLELTIAW